MMASRQTGALGFILSSYLNLDLSMSRAAGRRRLQHYVYLMQEAYGVPLGYVFEYVPRQHGPYSADLRQSGYELGRRRGGSGGGSDKTKSPEYEKCWMRFGMIMSELPGRAQGGKDEEEEDGNRIRGRGGRNGRQSAESPRPLRRFARFVRGRENDNLFLEAAASLHMLHRMGEDDTVMRVQKQGINVELVQKVLDEMRDEGLLLQPAPSSSSS